MLELISADERLVICFDTNHLLSEDPVEFIHKCGHKIVTLHVSDYDFIDEKHFGHHHSEETLVIMRGMVKDLRRLSKLLHEYDWYVSADTSEETFLERARDIMDGKR